MRAGILMDEIVKKDIEVVAKRNEAGLGRLEGSSVLVTGGSGFIGGYFLDLLSYWNENLAKSGCQIWCLDSFISGVPQRITHLQGKKYFTAVKQSIVNPLPKNLDVDYIVHCASIASPTFYRKYPIETMDANVLGTRNLLDYAAKRGIESMLFFSSSEVYGDPTPGHIPTPETYCGNVSFTGPRACYDESKRFGETLCVNFHKSKGVPVKAVRPFNVYGPGLRIDDKRVIPDLFSCAFKGNDIVLHGHGKETRSFCYAADALDGFMKVLLSDFNGEAFNVGNDQEEVTMLALALEVSGLFGGKTKIVHAPSAEHDYLTDNPQRRCPDLAKIRVKLGYSPRVRLREGLARLKAWYGPQMVVK